ncbi:putative Invariant surface glycoprotein [Trypanosoma vivax]|uniref:T. brucei spp.-specific protein n=2 Tax=Trypanosoma vivax (strain Y486) TaxID=1055687 RepID=F9WL89_TRYVY|nr:putative Invariant surface glycoprotein [Trypanosoma vivax]KAH8619561.1 putative Invariant surface glycoprotein [Trypanosoma vivax]CCD18277.1 hypothetical protein, conserved in T. vivax [Trypanosoma vivax Y486]|eukprot:CCD18277.1 hypothetical protein, conserved in T. vivax [Trypanosoma vivax Y486]
MIRCKATLLLLVALASLVADAAGSRFHARSDSADTTAHQYRLYGADQRLDHDGAFALCLLRNQVWRLIDQSKTLVMQARGHFSASDHSFAVVRDAAKRLRELHGLKKLSRGQVETIEKVQKRVDDLLRSSESIFKHTKQEADAAVASGAEVQRLATVALGSSGHTYKESSGIRRVLEWHCRGNSGPSANCKPSAYRGSSFAIDCRNLPELPSNFKIMQHVMALWEKVKRRPAVQDGKAPMCAPEGRSAGETCTVLEDWAVDYNSSMANLGKLEAAVETGETNMLRAISLMKMARHFLAIGESSAGVSHAETSTASLGLNDSQTTAELELERRENKDVDINITALNRSGRRELKMCFLLIGTLAFVWRLLLFY